MDRCSEWNHVTPFAMMYYLNMTKGSWVLQCPKEAKLPSRERGMRGMMGGCGAPMFPSISNRSSNTSHHGSGHLGLTPRESPAFPPVAGKRGRMLASRQFG